jgi:glyoxylase-like metal-dependent hydrolase (beta-lactamase superfamily II)
MSTKTAEPSGTLLASLVTSGHDQTAAEAVAPDIFVNLGVGNSYFMPTDDGAVLVNAGTLWEAERGKTLFDKISTTPLRYAVLTQSHVNQYGGLEAFMTPDTRLVAHRNYPDGRAYVARLRAYYGRRGQKLWAAINGERRQMTPNREFTPDILVDDRFAFEVGGRRFEAISTPGGETRDAMVVWLPDERVVITGNMFGPIFGHQPNLNTVRGDKPRWALQFIESAKIVRALKPELMLTGHETIRGADQIEQTITRIIDSVQWLHDQTVEGMNAGKTLHALMRDIKLPPELVLGEGHGKASWNVRATWTEYSGWFDYDEGTTALYDVPRRSVSADIAELAGGAGPLAERARRHLDAGRPVEALHLLDIALDAEPTAKAALAVKRESLTRLLDQAAGINLSETMWLRSELAALD